MKVDVKETTLVCPAKDTPGGTLRLSDFDLFHANIHNYSLQFFKPTADNNIDTYPNNDEITRILKLSLGQVLVPFYPVAGRLGKDDNGRIQIECNGRGVMLMVAEADCTLDEMLDGEFCPNNSKFKELILTVDYSKDISSYPIVLTKVTYFKCRGMCLAIGIHHMVVDGLSAMHFINSWADMACGRPIKPPIHDRRSIDDRALSSPKFYHFEFDANAILGNRKTPTTPIKSSAAYLKISPKQINTLKDKANADADASTEKYSTYESLMAHVWRCACKARGLPDDQKTILIFAVDARSRLCPPLPQELFGNGVQGSAPAAFSSEILEEPLSSTAARVRKAIKEVDDEYIRSGLAFLRDNPRVIDGFSGRPISQNPNLSIVSWTHMPMYTTDFGWGPPVYAAPASIRSEGKGYVLTGPSKEDGLALYICLETQHIELFKKLFYDI